MAREESDREEILREATGLVERAELSVAGFPETIVFGFRRNGAVSLFVSQNEVYQFDVAGAWRRSYLSGRLLKAEGGRLVELTRERSANQTILLRRDLSDAEFTTLCAQLHDRLITFADRLSRPGDYTVVGQVSATGTDVVRRFVDWLRVMLAQPLRAAEKPGLG